MVTLSSAATTCGLLLDRPDYRAQKETPIHPCSFFRSVIGISSFLSNGIVLERAKNGPVLELLTSYNIFCTRRRDPIAICLSPFLFSNVWVRLESTSWTFVSSTMLGSSYSVSSPLPVTAFSTTISVSTIFISLLLLRVGFACVSPCISVCTFATSTTSLFTSLSIPQQCLRLPPHRYSSTFLQFWLTFTIQKQCLFCSLCIPQPLDQATHCRTLRPVKLFNDPIMCMVVHLLQQFLQNSIIFDLVKLKILR
ncbi:hypothetical protein CC80DRAFT_284353 [Byssothecium circinans]|uniref:Uncharacterized protein n=1 Tax=Byssothecium circinans TaxID=147558 RepID=A0A6A5UB09_9PLEO|nr:hypothetical protein CC80DRAFT_284353 [Byssothecium circinans]